MCEETSSEQTLRGSNCGRFILDCDGDAADSVNGVTEMLFAAQKLGIAAYAGLMD
jgi:hypothetical protein